MSIDALQSIFGVFVLIAIAMAFSKNRKAINWRTVSLAFLLQIVLAGFVLYIPFGKDVLASISNGVQGVIDSAQAGINFLFGGLGTDKMFGNGVGFVFAVRVLPVIIFFSSLIAVLYYLGIMQWVVKIIGGGMQKLLHTSKPESLSATANIFVGQTEAPLIIKPYISKMSQSELFAVMVGGLASVAGSILAGYAGLGVELKYLIAASFMAAPGGLLMAKLILPETSSIEELDQDQEQIAFDSDEEQAANVIDAAASGAASGLMLAANVGAMLLAFIGLIALINVIIGGVTGWFGLEGITLEWMLGYIFAPLAWIIGVPSAEMLQAGSFIGQKLVVNEFVAYVNFVEVKETLSAQTQVIITFALCGFANLSSIAILLGGLGSMAPTRRHDIAKLGLHAVLAATLANLMSAAIAGVFISL